MTFIADILLAAAALGAGLYCFVLGRRLKKFNNLEKGVGGAIAVLSTQADELKATLEAAEDAANRSADSLADLNARAESVSKRLELQLAALQSVDSEPPPQTNGQTAATPPPVEGDVMFMRRIEN